MKKATEITGSSGKSYRLEKKVGQGLTSEVYRGVHEATETPVALKILRPGVSDMMAKNFWLEETILGALGRAELEAGDGRSNIPRLLDSQREGQVHFLVLEFVNGTPISRLLEKRRHLEEQEALEVANQVLRVFDLLHQDVRRTYSDFQLQNIWLQYNVDEQLEGIKVMDWNHVSEKVPDDQPLPDDFGAHDLARFGSYFYQMLTGKGADERGETERALEKRAAARWEKLSLGTRQIVMQALHPNPARRFATVVEFRQAVQRQLALWQSDWIDLLGEVKNTLSFELDTTQAKLAAAQLDMAKRLDAPLEQVSYYQKQLEAKTGQVSLTWQTGWEYYSVGQYRTALLDYWREEAEAQGRVELWRWVMIAQASQELPESFSLVREPLQEVVQALLENQVAQAQHILEKHQSQSEGSESVEALKNEVLVRQAIAQARKYESRQTDTNALMQAAKAYEQAEMALQKIPYQELLRDEEGWFELSKRAEQLHETWQARYETGSMKLPIRTQLNRPSTFQRGLRLLEERLRDDPTNRELVQLCLDESGTRLEKGEREQAIKLLEVAALWAEVPDLRNELEQLLKTARALQEEEQRKQVLQKIADDLRQALDKNEWDNIRPLVEQIPPGSVLPGPAWQEIVQRIQTECDEAIESRLQAIAIELMAALTLLGKSEGERKQRYDEMLAEIKQEQEEAIPHFIDEIEVKRAKSALTEYDELLKRIERVLPFAKTSDQRASLERIQRELKADLQQGRPEQLIREGQGALPKWMWPTMMGLLLLLFLMSMFIAFQERQQGDRLTTLEHQIMTVISTPSDAIQPTEETGSVPEVPQPAEETASAPEAPPPTEEVLPPTEPAPAPDFIIPILTLDLPQSGILYDVPTFRGQLGTGWRLQLNEAQALQIISDSTEATTVISQMEVWVNNTPVAGTTNAVSDNLLTWSPSASEPPLSSNSYTLILQGHTDDEQLVPLSSGVPFTVQAVPLTATLAQERLHTQAISHTDYLLDGGDGRAASPAPVGAPLEVLAKGPPISGSHFFLQVRVPQQRTTYWALYPTAAHGGQPNLHGITQEQVDSLPTINP